MKDTPSIDATRPSTEQAENFNPAGPSAVAGSLQPPPVSQSRRWIFGGVALSALALGGLVSWIKTSSQSVAVQSPTPQDLQNLWASEFLRPNGDPHDWKQFRGKPMIINFWATWCVPCIEEMPLIDRFYKENASKGWQVVGLAIDQPSRVRSFLSQHPVSYPVLLAGLGGTELSQALGDASGALPFSIILNADEHVLLKKLGKLKAEELKAVL